MISPLAAALIGLLAGFILGYGWRSGKRTRADWRERRLRAAAGRRDYGTSRPAGGSLRQPQ